jgi:hypothetical protein
LRYAKSKARQLREDEAYRVYVTDALQIISYNTEMAVAGKGSCGKIETRYWDLLNQSGESEEAEEDTRSCKEIVTDLWSRVKKGGQKDG